MREGSKCSCLTIRVYLDLFYALILDFNLTIHLSFAEILGFFAAHCRSRVSVSPCSFEDRVPCSEFWSMELTAIWRGRLFISAVAHTIDQVPLWIIIKVCHVFTEWSDKLYCCSYVGETRGVFFPVSGIKGASLFFLFLWWVPALPAVQTTWELTQSKLS